MFVLELATRDAALRSFSVVVMAALLISIPLISLGAAVMLCVRFYFSSSPASGLSFRHLLSPAIVLIVHAIYIVGFLLSPWPGAINRM
ncbi:MAG: hypothetical protein QOE70_1209 [Chthoniobacter sp.]|jgi:hypothetical protein|nr:hypothetical protein [Chthoniobacter sp.]